MAPHRIVIDDDDPFGRLTVEREPAPALVPWRGTGPERGAWEDAQAANEVPVEYIAPGRAA